MSNSPSLRECVVTLSMVNSPESTASVAPAAICRLFTSLTGWLTTRTTSPLPIATSSAAFGWRFWSQLPAWLKSVSTPPSHVMLPAGGGGVAVSVMVVLPATLASRKFSLK